MLISRISSLVAAPRQIVRRRLGVDALIFEPPLKREDIVFACELVHRCLTLDPRDVAVGVSSVGMNVQGW